MPHIRYYLPGIFLIFCAITIVAFPEILVALIALIMISAGIGALVIGHSMRKSETEFRGTEGDIFDGVSIGHGFTQSPPFRSFFHRNQW
jgi:hypothetical protein